MSETKEVESPEGKLGPLEPFAVKLRHLRPARYRGTRGGAYCGAVQTEWRNQNWDNNAEGICPECVAIARYIARNG